MIKVCKPLIVPAYTPSGKTSADPLGWTDELSGGSVTVPVGYDQEYIDYTSNMYYAVSLAASTAYTFHSGAYGGAPITLYDASGTQVAAATGAYDEDTGEYQYADLTYTPGAAGIFVAKFGVNDYMGMGEPYTATISPTPATHSCIVPAHAGSMAGLGAWGYLATYRDTAAANLNIPLDGLVFYAPLDFARSTAETGQTLNYSGSLTFTKRTGIPCVKMAGSGEIVTSGNATITGSAARTVSLWLDPTSSSQMMVFGIGASDNYGAFCVGSDEYKSYFEWVSRAWRYANHKFDGWAHIAATWDGTTLKHYFNGELLEATTQYTPDTSTARCSFRPSWTWND